MNNDLISREAVKKAFRESEDYHSLKLPNDVIIDSVPTVCGNNPKWCKSCVSKGKCASTRSQGKWVAIEPYTHKTFCPYCKEDSKDETYGNFCPNCGADMRGGTE